MKQATVLVYSYRKYAGHDDHFIVGSHKATAAAIAAAGDDPIPGTGEEVSITGIDDLGVFRRETTAWGELS